MATISNIDLATMRRKITKNYTNLGPHPGYIKSQINDALQAIEDWYSTNAGGLVGAGRVQASSAITAATSFNFSNAQKKVIGAYWFEYKFPKELL